MCRSIKVLRRADEPTTPDEFQKAALQYVRKISGFHKPSRANQESFDRAVNEIAAASERLLNEIGNRNRESDKPETSSVDAHNLVRSPVRA